MIRSTDNSECDQPRGQVRRALELAFWCAGREPLLDNDRWSRVLAQCVDEALERRQMSLAAFVFLPDGVRLVVVQGDVDADLSRLLYVIKRAFTRWVKAELGRTAPMLRKRLTVQDVPGRYRFRFWEPGPGEIRELNTATALSEAIDAVHASPVEAGLCEAPAQWKWSSWRRYQLPAQPSDRDLPRIQPVTDALSPAPSSD